VATEHAPGGPLHRKVAQCGRLTEDEARTYFRQLVAALAHCHGQVGRPVLGSCCGDGMHRRAQQLAATPMDQARIGNGRFVPRVLGMPVSSSTVVQAGSSTAAAQPNTASAASTAAPAAVAPAAPSTLSPCRRRTELRSPLPLQGVFHRDLQLHAVRLDACGGVVLTDFGYSAAKLLGSGEHADARDRSATPAFTPPEVLLGHSIVNASYDGESLGEMPKFSSAARSCLSLASREQALRVRAYHEYQCGVFESTSRLP
jgi:serine/threonine protein kinase